jgi:hypothetical protein
MTVPVDLGETKAAAAAPFDQLDRDHHGTSGGDSHLGRYA